MGSLVSDILYIRNSKRIIITLAAFTVGVNAWMMVPDVIKYDLEPDTYWFVIPYVTTCDLSEFPELKQGEAQRSPLKWWINCLSHTATGNYKLIPALFGIAVMPLVYLLGGVITNDRTIGLISLLSFNLNPLYRDWATQGTYDQVWAFFFVLSLIFLFKKHNSFSIGMMAFSISAKFMAGLLLPVFLYTMYNQTRNKKHLLFTIGMIVTAAVIGLLVLGINPVGSSVGFFPERWDEAVFRNISLFWQVIPVLALVVVINRNFIPHKKMPNQKTVVYWMLAFFMINPFVYFFTLQDTYSYRYVPLAAFISVFIGMTIVNMGNWFVERNMGLHKKTPKVKVFP